MPFDFWGNAVGPVIVLLAGGGTIGAAMSLSGRVGRRRKAVGEIDELVRFPDNRVLKVGIRFRDRWPGHQAGLCGPRRFGNALREGFAARHLSTDDFHQELFDMR